MTSFFQQWCQSFPSFWQCPSATGHPRLGWNIQCWSLWETVKTWRVLIRLRSLSHGPKELTFLNGITAWDGSSGFTTPQKEFFCAFFCEGLHWSIYNWTWILFKVLIPNLTSSDKVILAAWIPIHQSPLSGKLIVFRMSVKYFFFFFALCQALPPQFQSLMCILGLIF